MAVRTTIVVPARWMSSTVPELNGSIRGLYAAAVSTAATSTGGSSRGGSGERPKTSAAETATATIAPLLCAVSQPETVAVAAASASARRSGELRRCDASTTAGQNPTRNAAAVAFG